MKAMMTKSGRPNRDQELENIVDEIDESAARDVATDSAEDPAGEEPGQPSRAGTGEVTISDEEPPD